ncbi:MAG: hypothetical protein LBG50_01405 [Clostridiales Family XIII bacterium]|jgi:4-diphosphocytidyl-2-C-methyl-D-erythritol kinase|nr:hypothetical protein [Clostridiales Family XIII bacterium]
MENISILVKAYAKINHSLRIVGRRDDGYHLICSHMQAVDLHDDVHVEIAAAGRTHDGRVSVEMSWQGSSADAATGQGARKPPLPQGEGNIAHRAASLALRLWGGCAAEQGVSVRVSIAKRIPMAAGLAGGSADAAAVMLALAKALAPGAALADIMAAGAEVGADVPFCIAAIAKLEPSLGYADDAAAGASFICEGIGDVLSPAPPVRGFGVLIKPAIEVSTPTAYAAWDEGDFAKPDGGQGNDLEPVAKGLFPEIGAIMGEVEALLCGAGGESESGAGGAPESGAGGESESEPIGEADSKSGTEPKRIFMTGSGPTIIALYDDRASATQGYGRLSVAYKNRADVGAVIAFCLTD